MPVRVLMLIYRRPDLSPEEFRKHYEDVHMPLTRELAAHTFPLAHIRRYIPRSAASKAGERYPANVAGGNPADAKVDCVTELIFRDRAHLQAYFEMPHAPGAAARLEEEADNFAASYPTVILEDYMETVPAKREAKL